MKRYKIGEWMKITVLRLPRLSHITLVTLWRQHSCTMIHFWMGRHFQTSVLWIPVVWTFLSFEKNHLSRFKNEIIELFFKIFLGTSWWIVLFTKKFGSQTLSTQISMQCSFWRVNFWCIPLPVIWIYCTMLGCAWVSPLSFFSNLCYICFFLPYDP